MVKNEFSNNTPIQGLSREEAARRLKVHGPNILRPLPHHARLKEFLKTLGDPMAIMLILASGLYLLLGQTRDGLILLFALFPVLGVDVALHARSTQALKKMAQAFAAKARVLRDGQELEIPSEELVPGDQVLLKEGERILADGVIRVCANFSVEEAPLTGESEPVSKKATLETKIDPLVLEHLIFAGCTVLAGQAQAEILKTGSQTRFGGIARLVEEGETETTPLQKKTDFLVRRLFLVALGVALLVLVIQMVKGQSFTSALLSAVSLSMAAIPEEFPMVFTLFLSLGAWRLSEKGVLVKRLASVETLGSTTVICVDKTGTLTQGHFALESHASLGPRSTEEAVLEAAVLACEITPADPMEIAILAHAQEHGIQVARVQDRWELIYDFDFDPIGKHMSHVWRNRSDPTRWRIVAKGALEGILEHCDLSAEERIVAEKENERLATHGARVLAVAGRDGSAFSGRRPEDEKDLKFFGLLAFKDPLRPEVPEAVELCQRAGIRIKIITGDHLLTAHAVADAAGILHESDDLIQAASLEKLPPEERKDRILNGVVFARTAPEQKFAIVDTLRKAGQVVAMTGDGINDAPALKKADIGIAMGLKGTEVARASADMVLLSDSFSSITAAVAEGRRIYANIQRSFLFLVAFHIPIVVLALVCPILGYPLIFLPVHLVWLELIVHPVSALIFEGEPAPLETMQKPPRKPSEELLAPGPLAISFLSGLFLTTTVAIFYIARLPQGVTYARSAGLAVLILGNLLLVWAERSGDQPWWKPPFPKTRRFWSVWLLVALSLPAILEIHWMAGIFQVGPISLRDWEWAGLLAVLSIGWRSFGLFPMKILDEPGHKNFPLKGV